MIVWLASYPRSGNTFLRTVLYQYFGFKTYSIFNHEKEHFGQVGELTGHIEYENSWEDFYTNASSSKDIYFVKTHFEPLDEQPCIYIVRDGRMAILSYFYYHKDFIQSDSSLLELIVGDDVFGDWSSLFYKYNPFYRNQTLVIKYENLLNNTEVEIENISNFIPVKKQTKQWINPFSKLHEIEPSFFRRGCKDWKPDPYWTKPIEQLFWKKHSELMHSLGYAPLNPEIDFPDISESCVSKLFSEQILKWIDKKEAVLAKERQQYQVNLGQYQLQLQQAEVLLEEQKLKIKQIKAELIGVESSKFWKLRTQWFKLKKMIGLTVN